MTMRRFVTAAVTAMALGALAAVAAAACSGEEAAPAVAEHEHPSGVVEFEHAPGFEGLSVGADPGPQVVTETYLRYHKDLAMAQSYAIIFAEMYRNQCFQAAVTGVDARTWDKDKTVHVSFGREFYCEPIPASARIPGEGGFKGKTIYYGDRISITFEGGNYSGGSVTQGSCKQLPGSGEAATGSYTIRDNTAGVSDVTTTVSLTDTVGSSRSTTLNESLELSNGTTVEAGAEFGAGSASVSDTFTTTFGISEESTEDESHEKSTTVSDEVTVPQGKKLAIISTTVDTATVCDVHINAAVDWSKLSVDLSGMSDKGIGDSHGTIHRPRSYIDGDLLQGATFTCDSADCLYRVATGYDVRCPGCAQGPRSWNFKHKLGEVKNASERYIIFDGTRHQSSQADASITFLDVTGQEGGCVSDTLEAANGKPFAALDQDQDGVLDACKP